VFYESSWTSETLSRFHAKIEARRGGGGGSSRHAAANCRQDVSVNDGVRRVYLDLLAEQAGRNKLRVVAFCLMINRVHLVMVLESEAPANTFRHARGRGALRPATPIFDANFC
jgi:hypothetical protein